VSDLRANLGTDLRHELAGLALATPLLTASGCAGTGRELEPFTDLDESGPIGAFVTRTITLDPLPGPDGPRVVETPSGLLHAVGRQNPGLQGFLATELPWLAQRRVRTVVSIAGGTLAEWAELARRLGTSPGVDAVEVDLSAANREAHGRPYGADTYPTGKVLHVVRRDLPRGVPVLAKLVPESPLVDVARAAVDNGADGLVVGHGPTALALDPDTLVPALAAPAALSGPALRGPALRRVYDVRSALPEVPLVGGGGIGSGADALAFLAAGADAVQVGSVLFRDPGALARIAAELAAELARRDLTLTDVVGLAHRQADPPTPTAPGGLA